MRGACAVPHHFFNGGGQCRLASFEQPVFRSIASEVTAARVVELSKKVCSGILVLVLDSAAEINYL